MAVTRKGIVSLFTGVIIISLLFNLVKGIYDIPHLSCLFTCIFLSIAIGTYTLFSNKQFILRLTVIDLLFILMAIGNIYFYPPTTSLYGLAYYSLIILYWSIRQTGGLNAVILYSVILASTLILSTLGYLQILQIIPSNHPDFDITGPYGNPNIYAGVLCLLLSTPITVLLHFKRSIIPTHIYLLSIFTCAVVLPILWLVNCRSAWIAVLAIISYAIYRRISFSWRWGILTSLLILLVFYWLYQHKPSSADGRILIWKVTAQMIKEKPITGFSPHGFNANYMHFQGDYLKKEGRASEKLLADNNHNVYNEPLRWMVEYGIAGLLFYIGILYTIFSYKERGIRSLSAKMVCVSGLIWGFFSYPNQVYPVLIVMVIALAEMSNRRKKQIIKKAPCKSVFLKIVILLAMVGQGLLLIRTYQNQRELFQLSQYTRSKSSEELISNLSRLELVMKNETIFWIYYCHILDQLRKDTLLLEKITHWEQLYPSTHTYILKGDVLLRLGKQKDAEAAYWTAHYMVPSRQKARYKLAILYHQQGRITEAKRLANEVLTEKVKVYGFETYEMHRELQRIFENQLK